MRRLGQFDPSTGIIADIQWGPQQGYDPATGIMTLADGTQVHVGTPQESVSEGPPSVIPYVPQPPLVPISSGTTVSTTGATLPPGPAPRVNVPLSPSSIGLFLQSSTLISGVPNLMVLAGGGIGLILLSSMLSGGGRRRR